MTVSYSELVLSSQQKLIAAVFPVSFPAGEETAIQIRYDIRAVHEPKSPLLSFKYLIETGSHWAGTIGSGELRFGFWKPVESMAIFGNVNDFFELQDGNLVWRFADLEPDPSHNISVSFDPAQFGRVEQGTALTLPDTLTVRAFIDGRSQLVVRGDRVYWHHLNFAAPGRWQDPDTQRVYDEPTYLNAVAWYPLWPDQPDRENRDCGCHSSPINGIPPLAQQDQAATLSIEQARGPVTIIQQPEAGNDYTLIVEFEDGGPGGADWYEVTLQYVTSGPPGSIPVAHPQIVTTPQDTPVDITLTAFHAEGKPLAFALVAGPSHGLLAGSAPDLVYLPDTGYAGPDAFTFQASDGLHDSEVVEVGLIVGLPGELPRECTGPNLLRNGDFEGGFDGQGVGLGWGSFHTPGGTVYGFQGDRWFPVVYEGLHSQLIGLVTEGAPPATDGFAGIYQTITGLEPGAVYELSIAGMMREEAVHPDEDPHRYQVQWAYSSRVHGDWMLVAGWQDLPWDEISLRTEPDAFSTYTAHLVAPSQPLTLFLWAWSKWALPGREVDFNLDAISLRRRGAAPAAEP
ncbi:MAG: Ig-like domain-containing protein [Anaerolineae bacterium]